jgi:hypothetical protein
VKVRTLSGWILALACMLAFLEVRAQTNWLTVLGDPGNAAADTIEVDPPPAFGQRAATHLESTSEPVGRQGQPGRGALPVF